MGCKNCRGKPNSAQVCCVVCGTKMRSGKLPACCKIGSVYVCTGCYTVYEKVYALLNQVE